MIEQINRRVNTTMSYLVALKIFSVVAVNCLCGYRDFPLLFLYFPS